MALQVFGLCLGVDYVRVLCILRAYSYMIIHLVKFSKLVGSFGEIAARAHCNMFSLYKSFSHLGFLQGGARFDLTIPDYCLLLNFHALEEVSHKACILFNHT